MEQSTAARIGKPRLAIVTYPDPVLTKKAKRIETITPELRQLADDMIQTMQVTRNGVGLAAPQVGESIRMVIIDPHFAFDDFEGVAGPEPFAMVNPEIIDEEGLYVDEEGCLSLPDLFYPVERPERVTICYTSLDGDDVSFVAHDYMAKLCCHELDHLEGVLLWDRVSRFKRDWLKAKYKKMIKSKSP